MRSKTRSVLLVMHHWSGYLYGIQLGISQYIVQRPEWIWTRVLPMPDALTALSTIKADGAIAYVEAGYSSQLQDMGIPVVDISNWRSESPFPQVLPDDAATGKMAAQYLMDLGLRHFGVIGPAGAAFSDARMRAFTEALAGEQCSADIYGGRKYELPPGAVVPQGIAADLAAWLLHLPKPVGIFGTFDSAAAEVLEACRVLRIPVPDQVCVLGVDNDELISKFTHPPLSSIALQTQKIGFEAASLLDRLMAGGKAPKSPVCIPPEGVVARQSTNILTIPDDDVVAAVRFIREHVENGVTVDDVLEAVPVNRRYLERKFKKHVGRSPLQEIRLSRIEKAKELLRGTDFSMPAIAKHSGFPNQERLANVFREQLGITPTQYRRSFRLKDV